MYQGIPRQAVNPNVEYNKGLIQAMVLEQKGLEYAKQSKVWLEQAKSIRKTAKESYTTNSKTLLDHVEQKNNMSKGKAVFWTLGGAIALLILIGKGWL